MKLVVTGGFGFIGSTFVKMLLEQEISSLSVHSIEIIDSLTYAADPKRLEKYLNSPKLGFSKMDIRNPLIADVIQNSDGVVHFAAETHVDNSIRFSEPFIQTNIFGTENLIRICRLAGKQLLIVSTDEVYGPILKGAATEDSPLKPSSAYSASKASADLIALAEFRTFGAPIQITRSTNNYGPGQNLEKLIPKVIFKAKNYQTIPLYGNGLQLRDWISVRDHCLGIAAVFACQRFGEVFNIGANFELSNLELVNRILDLMDRDKKLISFVEDRPGHDFRYSVDSTKVRNELHWHPKYNLIEDLPKLVNSYL